MTETQGNAEYYKELRDENIDLSILGKGGISLYYNNNILEYDIRLLLEKGFKLIEFDGALFEDEHQLHYFLAEKLDFPGYYGKNFDAFNDCMRDYEVGPSGVLWVFRRIDYLNMKNIHPLLDIFAKHSRENMVMGRKLILLMQTDNKRLRIKEPIGALNFWLWNYEEWFEGSRS